MKRERLEVQLFSVDQYFACLHKGPTEITGGEARMRPGTVGGVASSSHPAAAGSELPKKDHWEEGATTWTKVHVTTRNSFFAIGETDDFPKEVILGQSRDAFDLSV